METGTSGCNPEADLTFIEEVAVGSTQCIKSALRSLFYYLSPFSFCKDGGKTPSECIYTGDSEEDTVNIEVSLINRNTYHCKEEPGAEFKFRVLGTDSVSILVIHTAKTSIFH